MVLFGAGFVGVVVVVIGLITMIGRRMFEPKKEIQHKINELENEIKHLKSNKC